MTTAKQTKLEPAAEWVSLDKLHEWAKNPRKNDGNPVKKVAESIKRFGFGAPILARKANGEIIAGHTRWKAAKSLGLETVPVRYLDLEPSDAHLLALADNRAGEEASWDDSMLASLLADMKLEGLNLLDTSFDDRELEKLLSLHQSTLPDLGEAPEPEMDRAEELGQEWKTDIGQKWIIPSGKGKHVLICGDCTNADSVKWLMGDEKAHAMWTDPPYGVSYVGKTADALTIENDKLTADELRGFLVSCFANATAVLQEGAAVYVAHPPGALSLQFRLAFDDVGWRHHQTLIWNKNVFALGHSDYHYSHEPILYGYTPGGGRRGRGGKGWYGDDAQRSVFDVDKPHRNGEHPTMKPPELMSQMVANSVPVGGLVYEPFNGSGSTMVAAQMTGRFARSIELDPKYVAVALQRMSDMGLKPELAP